MKSKVPKWGGSLAVRIPKSLADQLKLNEDSEVNIRISGGDLVISPRDSAIPTLEELLAGVTAENLHGEWDTGHPVGKEIV